MSTTLKQLIPIADSHISISCTRCVTEVLLDLRKQLNPQSAIERLTPRACPSCEGAYDSAVRPQIDQFRQVYAAPSAAKEITFRINPER
ncbi:MAG TPA: hypothetical protein VKB79_01995 [Bryobacteraceae bacterium]|nr:hypothetical protein [Bryobacteraceae bacterium]